MRALVDMMSGWLMNTGTERKSFRHRKTRFAYSCKRFRHRGTPGCRVKLQLGCNLWRTRIKATITVMKLEEFKFTSLLRNCRKTHKTQRWFWKRNVHGMRRARPRTSQLTFAHST